jgi:glycosyltransferase involved in cell wall biosynthesis
MRRILLLDLSSSFGGGDVRVIDTAVHLAGRFDMHVAVLAGSRTHLRLAAEPCVTVWPFARSRRDPRLARDLARLIRLLRPDVVDTHNPQSILWGLGAAAAENVPARIATVHSRFDTDGWRHALQVHLSRYIDFVGTGAVAVQHEVAAHLRRHGYRRHPLHVIENGIVTPPIQASMPAEPFTIATVGRLVPVKNHAVLLQAMARLREVCPMDALIVGDGPLRGRLERLAADLGLAQRVRFLGFRSDVAEIVSRSTVFCLPSASEALPYAALEAASLGVPVIASAVGGLVELFEHRRSALLVPPDDPAALAGALAWAAHNGEDLRALGARAAQHIRARYSMDAMLARTAELYDAA